MKRPLLVAVLALAACGNRADPDDLVDPEEPTDPDDPPTNDEVERDYPELASILAAHIRAEFALQLLSVEITEGRLPAGFSITGSTPEESTGVGSVGALNLNYAFHCNDGTMTHTIVPCDGNAHHSHIKYTIGGSQSIDNMTMSEFDRVVDWEVRDILLDKARFRGPDQVVLHTQVATEGITASYTVQFHAIYEQVRYLPADAFPTYGTIDFTVNTERLRDADRRVFDATAQLVYGASGVPTTLTIDGTHQYTIDLATGVVARI